MKSSQAAKLRSFDLEAIKNLLRGNRKRLRPLFSDIRRQVNPIHYPALAKAVYSNPFYRQVLFGPPFPKDVGQLKRFQPLNSAGLERELLWATSILEENAAPLREFLELKSALSAAVISCDYEAAFRLLDSTSLGESFWSLSARIYLTNELQGSEAKTALVVNTYKTPGINGLAYYLVYYYGFRVDKGASLEQIRKGMSSLSGLRSYLTFKLLPFDLLNRDSDFLLDSIVRLESNSSIIDLYEAVCRVIQLILAYGGEKNDQHLALTCSTRLNAAIPDQRTHLIQVILDPDEPIPVLNEHIFDFLDSYISQDLVFGASSFVSTLSSSVDSGKEGILSNRIATDLSKIADSRADSASSLDQITNLCSTLSCFDFAWAIYSVANRLAQGSRNLSFYGNMMGALNVGTYIPDISEFIASQDSKRRYLERLRQSYGNRASIRFFSVLAGFDSMPQSKGGKIARWLDLKSPPDSEAILAELPHYIGTGLLGRILRDAVSNLLEKGALSEAAAVVAKQYIALPYAWAQLPIKELIAAIRSDHTQNPASFAIAVVWDIYTRYYDAKSHQLRAFAVEDAWEAAGVSRPSELTPPDHPNDARLFGYYLYYLCIPSILDESDLFQKAREIDQERIRICQLLTEIDSESAEAYQIEIKSVTRRLVIQEGVRRVEQSKIYVDLDGLYEELIEILLPEFDRVMALWRDQIVGADVSELIKRGIKLYRDDEITDQLVLSLKQDDPEIALLGLVMKTWKEFATNSHHGLDVYLSTRIRHGTLSGHLRRPLDEQHLLCQRDAVSNIYRDQPYWSDRLKSEYVASEILQSHLKVFSAEIDSDISKLNSESLRVRTDVSGQGWFNFMPNDYDFQLVQQLVYTNSTLPIFVQHCLSILWRRLDRILASVREKLSVELRQVWEAKLNQLRNEAQTIDFGPYKADFDAAIVRAQAALNMTIDRVETWFTLSSSTKNPDYTIDLAVEIASESVRNCFGVDKVVTRVDHVDTPMLRGRTLASLVDVFFILIENAVRHASPENRACAVEVNVREREGLYTVIARNKLPATADTTELEKKISSAKLSLADHASILVASEGGTGFHKLRKIIAMDLDSNHTFDFEVQDRWFVVTIIFDARSIIT